MAAQSEVERLGKVVWNYLRLGKKPEPADLIVVLGSHDLRVPEHAAELYRAGFGKTVVCSGGFPAARSAQGQLFDRPEAEVFADVLTQQGVPQEHILLEPQSSNTGENVLFTQKLLEQKDLLPARLLLVHKPYMERRLYATVKRQWPAADFQVTSPIFDFNEEMRGSAGGFELGMNVMVGDMQRIKAYAELGYQIPQEIPPDVWQAYERLVELGYDHRLVPQSAGK